MLAVEDDLKGMLYNIVNINFCQVDIFEKIIYINISTLNIRLLTHIMTFDF